MSVALVTGGTGCLGTPLVRRLAGEGVAVRVLVQHPAQGAHLAGLPGVTLAQGDVTQPPTLEAAVRGVDVVYHLAAKVHEEARSPAEARAFFAVNTEGTAFLLSAARRAGTRRLVLVSTVGVYGESSGLSGDESTPVNPGTPYAESKLRAEEIVLSDDAVEGVVLRLPVAYGPGDRGNVGRLIRAIARRRFFLVKGASGRRSMVGAENVAVAAVLAGTHRAAAGEVFLVTDGPAITLDDLLMAVNTGLKRQWQPPRIAAPFVRGLAHAGSICSAITRCSLPLTRGTVEKIYGSLEFSSVKIQQMLGYRAVRPFSEGIVDELRWLQEQRLI